MIVNYIRWRVHLTKTKKDGPSKLEHNSLNRIRFAVEEFRSLYADAPLLSFQVFLTIATNQGVSGKELIRRLGASQSAISRHQTLLSTWTWDGKRPALNLIENLDDPTDGRGKVSFLTAKGRLLACSIIRIMDPEIEITPSDLIICLGDKP